MKKGILIFLLILFIGLIYFSNEKVEREKESIKALIQSGYIDGFFNDGRIGDMKKCFHDGFVMFRKSGGSLSKSGVEGWYDHVRTQQKNGKYPVKNRVRVKFLHIDVTKNAAMAKIALFRGGERFYTDYLSFYKFPQGWRLVGKIYQGHP